MRLDGRIVSKEIETRISYKVNELKTALRRLPKLFLCYVGKDDASKAYSNSILRTAKRLEIDFEYLHLEDIEEIDLLNTIAKKNQDNSIDGIMIQMPLPKNIDKGKVIALINPSKDIDGVTNHSSAKIYLGEDTFEPCTAKGILVLLEKYQVPIEGSNVVIVGRSNVVGKPLSMLLLSKNATVTIAHSKTKDLATITRKADIVVTAIGIPNYFDESYFTKDTYVIDAGTRFLDGNLVGDVNFDKVNGEVKGITPVPGGVGSITTMMLFENLLKAYGH